MNRRSEVPRPSKVSRVLSLLALVVLTAARPLVVGAQKSIFTASAGPVFGLPLGDPSARPGVQFHLGIEPLRESQRWSGRFVAEGIFHPSVIPKFEVGEEELAQDRITRIMGGGYDVRLPLRRARGVHRLALGVRMYAGWGEESWPFVLTMPRMSYEMPLPLADDRAGVEIGLLYALIGNRRLNPRPTIVFAPVTINWRF